ncbi:hypothetical protein [Streptomyces sp. STR69]|uniref:hypothetical protein n=1 Tax=Streptomyces sp. STR69 TaxID=1796942 RepID=UPI0021C6B4E7|nr:hypothetical protein [Streptomyces sp. STR69]
MSDAAGRRRVPVWLGIGAVVLAAVGGGGTWLFRDELFHPFGDARACAGSDLRLPHTIDAGGATLPADASDIHYLTRNGSVEVTFLSHRISDYLRRAGVLPEGKDLFDQKYGTKFGDGEEKVALPDGLCGTSLRSPAWEYRSTAANGTPVDIVVERSLLLDDAFRWPARAVVTFTS